MANTIACNIPIPNSNPTNNVNINIGSNPIINVAPEVLINLYRNPANIFNNTCPAIIFAIYKIYRIFSISCLP